MHLQRNNPGIFIPGFFMYIRTMDNEQTRIELVERAVTVLARALNNIHKQNKEVAFDQYLTALEQLEAEFIGSKPVLDDSSK